MKPCHIAARRRSRSRMRHDDDVTYDDDNRELGTYLWFTPNAIDPRVSSRRAPTDVSLLPQGRIKWNNMILPDGHCWELLSFESEEYLKMTFNARGLAGTYLIEHWLKRIKSQSRRTDCWELVLQNNTRPRDEQQAYMLPVHQGLLATHF